MRKRWSGLIVVLAAIGVASSNAADGPPRLTVDTSLYPYLDPVEDDTDLTVAINARFPARFSYFGYMNFDGVVSDGDSDFSRSEQNLRWALSDNLPLDLNLQAIIVDGSGNDVTQLGIGWRVHHTPGLRELLSRINLIYRITFQLKRFSSGNDNAWQMEHYFKLRFPGVSDRLYVSGFLDQTFNLDLPDEFPDAPIVTEIQGGVRIWRDFYAVVEYRKNDFRLGDESNLAAGIEYKYTWR
jgi:hypothetical protein